MVEKGFTFTCVRTEDGDYWKASDVVLALMDAADMYDEEHRHEEGAAIRNVAVDFSKALGAPIVKEPE